MGCGYNGTMGKISVKEIKAIMMVHEKADYSDKAKLKQLYNICVQRQMFSSKTGLKFQQAMLDIAQDRASVDVCIFCHGRIEDGKGVVCDECLDRLNGIIEQKQFEIEDAKRKSALAANRRARAEEEKELLRETREQDAKAREEWERAQAEKARLLAEEQARIEEKRAREKEEAKAHAAKLRAEDEEKARVKALEEERLRAEEEERKKNFTYVPFEFEHIEEPTNADIIKEKISKQKPALFTVLGVLTVIVVLCIYLFADKAIVANTTSDRGSELNYYMGKEYTILSSALGKSEPIVGENIRYFKNACVSVIYDETTGMVSYLDIDGDGTPKTSLLGIYPGMDRNSALSMLKSQNIIKEDKVEGEVYSYYIPYADDSNYKLQLDVSYIKDKVAMVSLQMMQNDD